MPAASIKFFIDQGVDGASASSLSNVVTALKDLSVTSHLASTEKPVCAALLQELIRTSNDSSKSSVVRFMALECLFYLSGVPDEEFRKGELFSAVQLLNESFSSILDREAEHLESHQEMLLVLLLRCTGYSQLKASDVLIQLCGGSESRLIDVILSILRNSTYERAITHTCFRFLYELSTPIAYFQARENESLEATSVTSFQVKVVRLIQLFEEKQVLSSICQHLTVRWQSSVQDLSHGLGILGSIRGYASAEISEVQKEEILHWSVMLRYIGSMIQNLADFCDQPLLVKELQQSLMSKHQDFLATVLIPFTVSSLFMFIRNSMSPEGGDKATAYVKSALLVLTFLRFALYKASAKPSPLLISNLSSLAQLIRTYEKYFSKNRVNILVLVYCTELLCYINAVEITAPQDLSSDFRALLTTIAEDKSPVLDCSYGLPVSHYFVSCFFEQNDEYSDSNPSVKLVNTVFEDELSDTNGTYEDRLEKLKLELEIIQNELAQLTLAGLFSEVVAAAETMLATTFFGTLPICEDSIELPSPVKSKPSPPRKKNHPKEFCCQLTGKLMREPVVLKNGHHFELDALQAVIDDVGHVDPISGETLNEGIEIDASLLQRITAYKVEQSVKNAKKAT